ncbi:YisL family protein [Kurthia gibsonii]|uniref:YisL family protein n=1 Tax=Kurthia gibsonii TaxID=33946 RepID=UPI002DB6B899|nr:YisL family protein [Kurthia gibsonii]MEB7773315.1 YisL family protein [Kurthia gibsonii]
MLEFLGSQTHLHITTWVVALILFFVAVSMQKGSKGRKITHMILRLFYILIIATGVALFITALDYGQGMLYGFKLLFGLGVIAFMELVLVRGNKGKSTGGMWAGFIICLIVVLVLGFKLPMGFQFF